jgi:hypothetical protein
MKKQYKCSFYYECFSDVERFINLLEKNKIYCISQKHTVNGDMQCVFETTKNFESNIKYLGVIDRDDLHVIFESLNYTEQYSGTRDKALLKTNLRLIKS